MECTDYDTSDCEVVQMRKHSKIKEITTRSNMDLVIELDVEGVQHNFVIIWFQTVLKSDESDLMHYQASDIIDCQGSESSIFIISNLTANHAYTICVVNKEDPKISPFDCMPYYVRSNDVPDADSIWLLEEDKALVIGLVIGAAILSVIFGLALSFFLIRRNPTWLRGSKRLVRLSNTRSDVMVMPPEWRKPKKVTTKEDATE